MMRSLFLAALAMRSSPYFAEINLAAPEKDPAGADERSDSLPEGVVLRLRSDTAKDKLSRFTCVVYSPDGKTLATCEWNSPIRTWDAASGKEVRRFVGTEGTVGLIAFSPDGKFLASTGQDKTIHLWNPNTGKEVGALRGHTAWVRSMAFSSDNKTLATGAQDKTIRIWDIASRKEIGLLTGCKGIVSLLSFSADGKVLASASDDGKARLWDLASGKEARSWEGKPSIAVAFSPASNSLAMIGDRGPPCFRDAENGKVIHQPKHGNEPQSWGSLAFSPDGRLLATGGLNEFSLWEASTGKLVMHVPRGKIDFVVLSLAFSPDGKTLATCGDSDTALVWDLTGWGKRQGPQTPEPTPDQTAALWSELIGEDAAKAHGAIWSLVAAPKQALPLLKDRLRPITAKPEDARRWIEQLDDEKFAVRQKASAELEKLRELAVPALRKKLSEQPSAEARRHIERLLEKLDALHEDVRMSRAVAVLEYMGTPEAQQLLKSLATGCEGATLTETAKGALKRMTKRGVINAGP
jgi:WD40 repeat protein